MDANAITPQIAVLRRSTSAISDNLRYIQSELPRLDPPQDLRAEIVSMCRNFENAMRDLNMEIRNLEEFPGPHSGSKPGAAARLIDRRLREEIQAMHKLVMRLRELAPEASGLAGLEILVTESAANILYAYRDLSESLEVIAARLK